MLYITGIHALNISCSLETCGDWHTSALNWNSIILVDSSKMFFKDYGIELHQNIPENTGEFFVANHIRALLDLLELEKYNVAQGMNNDYICTSIYDKEIFDLVYKMNILVNWEKIDSFMEKEYLMKWINYKRRKEI